ncbi:Calx-beta domain-containing protein [Flavobacterium sp. 102]|uniref:DUF7619 domain-containing protein n=1 Tax=Flavobacterium sp. 102 TaxID=2135623 RepID=UPI000EADD191|nr:Calx-beta domain-containing protein [Flavobacterium sp. 102]RKS01355.1 putative repeat protein (TIGR01451 family)/predicted secreted protein (Por secretion system target) [Flavobacterium sp. 102]
MKKAISTSPLRLLIILVFGLFFNLSMAQNPFVSFYSLNSSATVIEGSTFSFNVKLNSVSATNTVINVTTSPESADISDYTPITATVTIPAGQLFGTTTLNIATTNDSTIENNEELFITGTVTSGNTLNATASYVLLIFDNDSVPDFYVDTAWFHTESNNINFYYYLSNPYSSDVVINWATTTGTAGSSDFTAINTTTSIQAGQSSGLLTIYLTDDALPESDEIFTLTGTVTSGNTTNLSATSIVTIRDNDTTPTLSINTSGYAPYEGNNYSFNASLDRPFNSDVVVQITTADGTAGSSDYTAINTTKTIPAGNTSVLVSIPITDDTLDEPFESFSVIGTVTSGNTTNPSVTSTVNITDNDGLPDAYFLTSYDASNVDFSTVEEGQNARFGIGLTHARNTDTVIQITSSNGTAGSADYTSFTTSITIPEGQTHFYSNNLAVPTILDQLQETDETFSLTATLSPGITFNNTYIHTVTILDNYNVNAKFDNVDSVAEVGTTFSLLANDTLHGLPLNASDVSITLAPNTLGITVNSQGVISIPSNLEIGYYELSYTICEVANPANCDTASISLQVKPPLEVTYNLIYSDYNGDGYTSVGDIITYQFHVANIGNAPITNIVSDYAYNLNIIGGPIANLNAGQTDTTTFTAIHIITQDDINFGYYQGDNNQDQGPSFVGNYYGYSVTDWSQIQNPFTLNISDGIKLKAFVDTNANGVQDGVEINFPLGHFNYEINNNGTIHNLYTTPFYLYESNPTTTYDLTYQVDSDYAANNICSVSYPNVTVAPGSGITTYNFPIITTPYQDLSVNMHNYGADPRPGFLYYSYITYTNNSNLPFPSGTLTFTNDTAVSIVTVSDGNAVVTSTGFTFNFVNLQPYETRTFWVQMTIPNIPTVNLGQTLTNTVSITLPAGDILPLNNTSNLTETIVGSYDPNEKTESHGGRIVQSSFSANDYLTYTIKFENTGTANAINVKVTDVLAAELDETSIKMVTASHTYALERINNTLTWNFFGIDLPPSVPNTNIGHGYIVFQIKPKPDYAIGDIINNTANIYFDFNPAIVTDPCLTEFVQSLDNETFAFTNFSFHPNPVKNILTISNETIIDEIEITSVLGQKIKSIKANNLQAEIDLSELTSGIYLIKVSSVGQEKTIKIIKD